MLLPAEDLRELAEKIAKRPPEVIATLALAAYLELLDLREQMRDLAASTPQIRMGRVVSSTPDGRVRLQLEPSAASRALARIREALTKPGIDELLATVAGPAPHRRGPDDSTGR